MPAAQRRGSGRRASRSRSPSPAVASQPPPQQPCQARRSARPARPTRSPSPAAATEMELRDPHKWMRKGSGRRLRSPKKRASSSSVSSPSPARSASVEDASTDAAAAATAAAAAGSVSLSLPWVYTAATAFVMTVGKLGDIFAPTLVGTHPLLLLSLNANDINLALTSTTVPVLPWTLVGMARRLVEDPVRCRRCHRHRRCRRYRRCHHYCHRLCRRRRRCCCCCCCCCCCAVFVGVELHSAAGCRADRCHLTL